MTVPNGDAQGIQNYDYAMCKFSACLNVVPVWVELVKPNPAYAAKMVDVPVWVGQQCAEKPKFKAKPFGVPDHIPKGLMAAIAHAEKMALASGKRPRPSAQETETQAPSQPQPPIDPSNMPKNLSPEALSEKPLWMFLLLKL